MMGQPDISFSPDRANVEMQEELQLDGKQDSLNTSTKPLFEGSMEVPTYEMKVKLDLTVVK